MLIFVDYAVLYHIVPTVLYGYYSESKNESFIIIQLEYHNNKSPAP